METKFSKIDKAMIYSSDGHRLGIRTVYYDHAYWRYSKSMSESNFINYRGRKWAVFTKNGKYYTYAGYLKLNRFAIKNSSL
jgi:hypothetical protein